MTYYITYIYIYYIILYCILYYIYYIILYCILYYFILYTAYFCYYYSITSTMFMINSTLLNYYIPKSFMNFPVTPSHVARCGCAPSSVGSL